MNQSGSHWKQIARNEIGILELSLDSPSVSQNVLSSEVISELSEFIQQIRDARQTFKGLIFTSRKEGSFIVGADISEFQKTDTAQQAEQQVRLANQLFHQIETLPLVTVAAINGHCFGGGFELALACDYRVMNDEPNGRIGLPEIKLGIHPGFGGTVRLPESIGVLKAMKLILSGKVVTPFVARQLKMVDYIVPPRQLIATAEFLIESGDKPKQPGLPHRLFQRYLMRVALAKLLHYQTAKKVSPEHYPAPFAVIENWKQSGQSRESLFAKEQTSIVKLLTTRTSKNLVDVFFLQEHLKQNGKISTRKDFKRAHIIGAGVMGGDIAAWCALKGITVTLHDRSPEALARATKRAHELFKYKLKTHRLIERAMDRFKADTSGDGARHADIIIEAVFENLEVKQHIFTELERTVRPDAILATNTSSIPLEEIAKAINKPSRLVGIHFFNPVAKMQLIEIVTGRETLKKVKHDAALFARNISRLPVFVKSNPGFLVNRVLMPYAMEAVELLNQGVAAETIDQVASDFGMPMGPITLADTVGLDICLHVAENLSEAFQLEIPAVLQQKVNKGELGKKSGKGFYMWNQGKQQRQKIKSDFSKMDTSKKEIENRLIARYLNECIACLDDGIVANSKSLDAALVFGTGFAPFRGGPMNFIEQSGEENQLQILQSLFCQYGSRFQPAAGWKSSRVC